MKYSLFDTIFLVEVKRYEQAANYMLREAFGDKLYDMRPREVRIKRKQIATELKRQYNLLRKEYHRDIAIEQIRQIARETYNRTCQALDLC